MAVVGGVLGRAFVLDTALLVLVGNVAEAADDVVELEAGAGCPLLESLLLPQPARTTTPGTSRAKMLCRILTAVLVVVAEGECKSRTALFQ